MTKTELLALSSDDFEYFCHLLLRRKYGPAYEPYDREGLDGKVESEGLGFQCYHPEGGEFKWEKAETLGSEGDCLVFRLDFLQVDNLHQLAGELRCGTLTPTEALGAALDGKQSVLLLDALDALRTTTGQQAILAWLQDIHSQTDWHVVMSVRTYEAQYSSPLQQLFPARLVVNPLTDAEWNNALSQSPTLADVTQHLSPRLLPQVLRNLFNLRLLAQLIHRLGAQATDCLRDVQSEVELYDVFWQEVVRHERGRRACTERSECGRFC